jgi:hypothetical protein
MDLRLWIEERVSLIARRWHSEIMVREGRREEGGDGLLEVFLHHLVSFLPPCLGEHRDPAEEVWQQATHLFGTLALRRGLAAGEVVEELQFLRGVILKTLFDTSSDPDMQSVTYRDLLVLNRILDLGVVQASVAYVDDLFFAHLQGSGVAEQVTPELVDEITRQLGACRRELKNLESGRKGGHAEAGG